MAFNLTASERHCSDHGRFLYTMTFNLSASERHCPDLGHQHRLLPPNGHSANPGGTAGSPGSVPGPGDPPVSRGRGVP